MSAAEMLEWQRLDATDPLPDRRGDWQHAALSATILNALAKRQDGQPWRPVDLLLFGRQEAVAAHDRAAVARQAAQVMAALKGMRRDVR